MGSEYPEPTPPNTRFAPCLCRIDRGENYHGSLSYWLWAVPDEPECPSRLVMWIGENGNQAADDVPRITPEAFAEMPDDGMWSNEEVLAEFLKDFLSSLLSWEWIESRDHLVEADVFSQSELDTIWANVNKDEEDDEE